MISQFSCVVVVPTFNHSHDLPAVLQKLSECHLPVIVIDDGSTDETENVLSNWTACGEPGESRIVLRHPTNRGKAEALRTGLSEAERLNYTHVATFDSDGQHVVEDLEMLIPLASSDKTSLVVGVRTLGDARMPIASRIGRTLSNFLVWIECGIRVTDSQSGLRVYPIAITKSLGGYSQRYGYESEILVLAGWHGVSVIEHSIHNIYDIPGHRITHFRLWADTAAAMRMHARLLVRALGRSPTAPNESRSGTISKRLAGWFSPRRLGRMASGDVESRNRLAASIGVGFLIATLPIYGFKTVVCLWLSARFQLHPLAVLGISSLSTPPIGLVFIAFSICVGGLLLHGVIPDLFNIDYSRFANWSTAQNLVVEWAVGSVVGGLFLGATSYLLMRIILMRSTGVLKQR